MLVNFTNHRVIMAFLSDILVAGYVDLPRRVEKYFKNYIGTHDDISLSKLDSKEN